MKSQKTQKLIAKNAKVINLNFFSGLCSISAIFAFAKEEEE